MLFLWRGTEGENICERKLRRFCIREDLVEVIRGSAVVESSHGNIFMILEARI